MLTTIVCLVTLSGSPQVQRLTFTFTEAAREEFSQVHLGAFKQQVCTHLQDALEASTGE